MAITLDGSNLTTSGVPNSGTAVSASGTSVDFTIPIGAKRITVMFNGVSTSGTNATLIQLGDSGGIENTGYVSSSCSLVDTINPAVSSSTAGFIIRSVTATNTISGHMVLTNISGNIWISSHYTKNNTTTVALGGGDKTLSDVLTQIRLTTTLGTDTFDAGTINILYE
jgi:hypothetical protein